MKKIFLLSLISIGSFACTSNSQDETISNQEVEEKITVEDVKKSIKVMDDSLTNHYKDVMENGAKLNRTALHEAINRHLELFKRFPEDEGAAASLDKAQQLYEQLRIDEEAKKWRDTLIINYTDFDDRSRVIETQISHYDNFEAYEPEMIKKYTNMLLKDSANLTAQKVNDLKYRLDNIDLSFMELVAKKEAEQKGK